MSLKKIEQTKSNKFFKPADIIIYGVILAVIIILFIVFVFMRDQTSLGSSGAVVQVSSKGVVVFEFDFSSGGYDVPVAGGLVEVENDGSTIVTVYTDESRQDYNIIVFDTSGGGKVLMRSANCSLRHDCTYMSISSAGDSIVCIPHGLSVYVKSAVSPPTTG